MLSSRVSTKRAAPHPRRHRRPPSCRSRSPPSSSRSPPIEDVVGVVQIVNDFRKTTRLPTSRAVSTWGTRKSCARIPKVDPWLPGKPIKPDRGKLTAVTLSCRTRPATGIVINIAAMRLFYFPPHKSGEPQVVITHPIGIGKVGWTTREGVTKIVRRQADPTWHRARFPVIKEHQAKMARSLETESSARVPTIRSARFAFYLQWPSHSHSRHQQARRSGPALESRLHSSLP